MKKYKVREGFTFVGADGKVLGGGAEIDLEDDVAQLHLHKLEPAAPVQTSAQKKPNSAKAPAAAPTVPPVDPIPAVDPAPADQLLAADGQQDGADNTGA